MKIGDRTPRNTRPRVRPIPPSLPTMRLQCTFCRCASKSEVWMGIAKMFLVGGGGGGGVYAHYRKYHECRDKTIAYRQTHTEDKKSSKLFRTFFFFFVFQSKKATYLTLFYGREEGVGVVKTMFNLCSAALAIVCQTWRRVLSICLQMQMGSSAVSDLLNGVLRPSDR